MRPMRRVLTTKTVHLPNLIRMRCSQNHVYSSGSGLLLLLAADEKCEFSRLRAGDQKNYFSLPAAF
jgi:hypothetical protein